MVTLIVSLNILTFASDGVASASVDTVASASVKNFYGPAATIDEIAKVTFEGIVVVSTTNEDGTPNAAVVIPALHEGKYLTFGLAPNQTLENFKRGGKAVVTIFLQKPGVENPTFGDIRKYGARLYCDILLDGEEKAAFIERYNVGKADDKKMNMNSLLLVITKIDPIG